MTIDELLAALNTTAMVLGYITLSILLGGFFWLVSVWHEAWRYKRRRKRRHDIEWDNLRSRWMLDNLVFETNQDRVSTVEQPTPNGDRISTDVLDFTVEQIYDYQKDQHRDVS